VLLVALPLAQGRDAPSADATLAEARRLYATAAYEDALSRLADLESYRDPDIIDQYRALCLLGLNRTAEAERALERIVLRTPQYRPVESDVSPRLLALFTDVRTRTLPLAVRALYATARTSFEVRNYAATVTRLKDLLVLLGDDEGTVNSRDLADLKQLAQGFLRLAEAELAASTRTVYSSLDKDVTPPVDVELRLPPWQPPALVKWRSYRGLVQVVIDEYGAVERATLAQPMAEFYDADLVEAARSWRFKPAIRNGQPVKYRKLVEVTQRPQ
jgi:TonB family protein